MLFALQFVENDNMCLDHICFIRSFGIVQTAFTSKTVFDYDSRVCRLKLFLVCVCVCLLRVIFSRRF